MPQDENAAQLYRTSGFVAEQEDHWFVKVMGLDRRYLMVKRIGSGG